MQHTGNLYAQWTREDSLWIQNIVSGKEELRLKPCQANVAKPIIANTQTPGKRMATTNIQFIN